MTTGRFASSITAGFLLAALVSPGWASATTETEPTARDHRHALRMEGLEASLDTLAGQLRAIELQAPCSTDINGRPNRVLAEVRRLTGDLGRLDRLGETLLRLDHWNEAVADILDHQLPELARRVEVLKSMAGARGPICAAAVSSSGPNAEDPGDASLSGAVTDAATTNGIEGEWVGIYDAGGNYLKFTYSDATGAYTLPALMAGTYYVRVDSNIGYFK